WTHTEYHGPGFIEVEAPLDRMPLFVRGGAIIPFGPVKQHDAEPATEALTLLLYPGEGRTTELYRDDGISQGYQRGEYRVTRLMTEFSGARLRITFEPPDPHEHTLQLRCTTAPSGLSEDGAALA